MIIILGKSRVFIESFFDLKVLKEIVDTLNDHKKGGSTAWDDIPEGALKEFLYRRYNKHKGLVEVDYSKIKLIKSATAEAAKDMKKLFKDIKAGKLSNNQILPSITAKFILATDTFPTGDIVQKILDCYQLSDLKIERTKGKKPYPSKLSESMILNRCYFKLSKDDREKIKEVRNGRNCKPLCSNEDYTRAAVKYLMAKINELKIDGLQIIPEATQDFYKNNPGFKNLYNNNRLIPDALVAYKKIDGVNVSYITIPCEVFSFMTGEKYEDTVANKIMDASENFQYLPKVITSDKASSVEEAKTLVLNSLRKNDKFNNSSAEEKVQYEWEATHNISVGETNLDAIYDMFYMALDRIGLANKLMPDNKFDLFKA